VVDDDTATALAATKKLVFGIIMMGVWHLQGFTTWRLRTVSA
jgi:hypothetical protein